MGCQAEKIDDNAVETEEITHIEPVNVKVETVKKHLFGNKLRMPGEVKPFEEIMITAKVAGDIKSIYAEVGEVVKQGQILGTIDDTMYGLMRKKALLGVDSAEVNLDEAKRLFDNYSVLFKENAVSKNTYDIYEKAYKLGKIGLEVARTDFATADENYRYTSIKSPINGIVSEKEISAGENLNMGAHLFTVVNMGKAYIEAGISEMNINKLSIGMAVDVTVDSAPGTIYKGEITHIGPVPGATNTYPVKVLIENSENVIKSGMYATAEVELGEAVESIAVPKKAVQHDSGKNYVLVADGDNAKRLDVILGLSDEQYYEITDGLAEGERVIISGYDIVNSGEPIIIQN